MLSNLPMEIRGRTPPPVQHQLLREVRRRAETTLLLLTNLRDNFHLFAEMIFLVNGFGISIQWVKETDSINLELLATTIC